MKLTSLTLQNFRSYSNKTFEFSAGTTIIFGANAAGKTNILEAIMLLATGKSFRADREAETIQWEKDFSRILGRIDDLKLELFHQPLKRFLVNGVSRRMIDFVGNLRAVLFWPEDLELVTDSPSYRRKYLDSVLVQVDREYRRNLFSYERGLRQRNKLLDLIQEGKASRSQLLFWNQLLVKAGEYITNKREEFLAYAVSYHVLGSTYNAKYDKSIISESRLAQYKDEEIAAKSTLVGPHRDDFFIFEKNIQLSKYGSRGEQRLAVLWLKLAQLAFIEKYTGTRPILLLDDIFSELDTTHRKVILDVTKQQLTIITSANTDIMGELGHPDWQQIRL